jgi:hypothetical protein
MIIDLKQWRKTVQPGDPVLFVKRNNGRIYEWRHTTITRIQEGRPSISYLGVTSWASLLPASMEAQIEAEDAAYRAAISAKADAHRAAINALFDAGADVVIDGFNHHKRPGYRPVGITGYTRMAP